MHLATAAKHDAAATHNLIDAARRQGRRPHLVFVSIVGVDRIALSSYREKRAAEELVEDSGLPWTIARATQFHDLLAGLFGTLSRSGLLPVLARTCFQPIDVRDVAARLIELDTAAPAGRAPDLGGPQVRPMEELARAWLQATRGRRPVLAVSLLGGACAQLPGRRAPRPAAPGRRDHLRGVPRGPDLGEAAMTSTAATRSRLLIRTGLMVLTASQAVVGMRALLGPRSFLDGFPATGHAWVALLPPFDEHLVRDVGGLSLAMAVLLGTAAVIVDRTLYALRWPRSPCISCRTPRSTASTSAQPCPASRPGECRRQWIYKLMPWIGRAGAPRCRRRDRGRGPDPAHARQRSLRHVVGGYATPAARRRAVPHDDREYPDHDHDAPANSANSGSKS